ncbi:MAG: DUF998 domain-containing protein [Gemmatimonadota bacterium]
MEDFVSSAPDQLRLVRLVPEGKPDDVAGPGHRQVIGWLGAALPVAIVGLDRLRPTPGLTPDELTSISAYYYSSGVIAFAGVLSALTVYLLTYRGYDTPDGWKDRRASRIAAVSGALVVFFPTDPPGDTPDPSWWRELIGQIHYGAAIVFFLCFVYFCLFRFTKSGRPKDEWDRAKRFRNALFLACGVGIALALGSAALAGRAGEPIFWQEVVAIELFALSWLVKGHAIQTAQRTAQRGLYYVTHPGDAVVGLGRAIRGGPSGDL